MAELRLVRLAFRSLCTDIDLVMDGTGADPRDLVIRGGFTREWRIAHTKHDFVITLAVEFKPEGATVRTTSTGIPTVATAADLRIAATVFGRAADRVAVAHTLFSGRARTCGFTWMDLAEYAAGEER